MIRIKVSTAFPYWPLVRQTPGSMGIWGNCQFFIDDDEITECDYWVICDNISKESETVRCSLPNVILVTWEPPSVKKYPYSYIQQFSRIISCHRTFNHPNVIYMQQALPWMVGGKYNKQGKKWEADFSKDYDELSDLNFYKKEELLSIIVSNKSFTKGHRKRKYFLDKLRNEFCDELKIFGIGYEEIIDKWDAIAPFKYHLVIENSSYLDYWTEKLSDAFLGGAYPIYFGCPNIYQYFSENSLSVINIDDFDSAVKKIRSLINNHSYEAAIPNLLQAKNLVLNKYNFFALIENIISSDENKNFLRDEVTICNMDSNTYLAGRFFQKIRNRIF